MTPHGDRTSIAVVIVNYRTPRLVIDCLATLLPELQDIDARVVVVDNDSQDDSVQLIGGWIERHAAEQRVRVVPSSCNSGFAGGNNAGIAACDADHYLLLNSDTLVRRGAIRRLIDTAAAFPSAGLISPRLEWPDGAGQESCFRFHSPVSELIGASQTGPVETLLRKWKVAMPVQDSIAHPEWTSFACVLIRRQVFEQVGLLDDGYFMYFEDVEFCHRAREAGWDIVHDPEARVVHLRGGSSPVKERARQRKRLPRYFYESRTRYFRQTWGPLGPMLANLMWLMGRSVAMARQLFGRTDKAAIERQWLDIWTNWRRPLAPSDFGRTVKQS
ncbi:MAG TPA: glycosyltransferase family 2 protein [Rhodocyclaceae bacterium]